VDSATFPDETISPHPLAPESRVRTLIRHPERSAALLAVLIGFASVFSAVIAWRASLASIDSSRYESLAVQQQARREQIERELEGSVQQDQRFIAEYQEHALAAREIQAQADSLRPTDAAAADLLDLEAQNELAKARAMTPFFRGLQITLDENGNVPYDATFVLRNLEQGNPELRELRTSNVAALAGRADAKSLDLIGVAALIVGALFFLTVAQVSRTRQRLRQAFFVAGGIMVVVGTVGFLLVEVLA
jgi:hypothetical protein